MTSVTWPLVPFIYLRHGETDWNRDRLWQGQTDIPLNETGRAQARAARDALKDQAIATICTSPLKRARETADIVNEIFGVPVFEDPALMEVSFGPEEGKKERDWIDAWRDGTMTRPGVEAVTDFLTRTSGALVSALARQGPVLIVAHGGVYWSVQRYLLGQALSGIPNAVPIVHAPPGAAGDWTVRSL